MTTIKLERLCRLCGVEKSRMRSIFEPDQEHPLRQIIDDIVRLNVEPDDGLPQNVCHHCTRTLLKLNESVELFRDTDLKLREQLRPILPIKIKLEEETEMDSEMLDEFCKQELDVKDLNVDASQELILGDTDGIEYLHEDEKPPKDEDIVENNDSEWKPTNKVAEEVKREEPPKRKRSRKQEPEKDPKPKRPYRKREPGAGPRSRKKDPSQLQKNDHKCYICNSDNLGSAEALLVHLHGHSDQLPYTCADCDTEEVVIKAVSTLNLHKRMHLNPIKCPMCYKRFSTNAILKLHIEACHSAEQPMACEHCGKVCPTRASLSYHLRLHTSVTSCEYCGKVFVSSSKLKKHITRTHSGGPKHECHLCHKKLSSLDGVQAHIKIMHSTEEFKCTVCSRTYSSDISLRAHMKRHEKNPGYEPSKQWQEYYTFVEGDEGIKNGVRLKKCNICGEIRSQIGTHLQSVHFPEEFRCEICNETFKRKVTFEMHVLKHTRGAGKRARVSSAEDSSP